MNTHYCQILRSDCRSENLRYLSDQNPNFGGVRRIATEIALADLFIYLIRIKFDEMIDTAAVRQTVKALLLLLFLLFNLFKVGQIYNNANIFIIQCIITNKNRPTKIIN